MIVVDGSKISMISKLIRLILIWHEVVNPLIPLEVLMLLIPW